MYFNVTYGILTHLDNELQQLLRKHTQFGVNTVSRENRESRNSSLSENYSQLNYKALFTSAL